MLTSANTAKINLSRKVRLGQPSHFACLRGDSPHAKGAPNNFLWPKDWVRLRRYVDVEPVERGELRKERIEAVPDGDTAAPRAGQMPEQAEHRSVLGRHRSS